MWNLLVLARKTRTFSNTWKYSYYRNGVVGEFQFFLVSFNETAWRGKHTSKLFKALWKTLSSDKCNENLRVPMKLAKWNSYLNQGFALTKEDSFTVLLALTYISLVVQELFSCSFSFPNLCSTLGTKARQPRQGTDTWYTTVLLWFVTF